MRLSTAVTALSEEPVGAASALDPVGEIVRLLGVMDTLRSPGGCPWDAAQTHLSLVPFSLEETYELAEVIEDEDRAGLREELGDLLLQVVFHARIAAEHPTDPFDMADVARGIADKLIRRHPYVFVDTPHDDRPTEAGQTHRIWDEVKATEKQRTSILDGIPRAQPALARTQKVLARAQRAGLLPALTPAQPDQWDSANAPIADDDGPCAGRSDQAAILSRDTQPPESSRESAIGHQILTLVLRAQELGVDAESALRHACRELETHIRDRESPGAPA